MARIEPLKDQITGDILTANDLPFGLTPDDVRDYCRARYVAFWSRKHLDNEGQVDVDQEWFTIADLGFETRMACWEWVLHWKNRTTDAQVLLARDLCVQLPLMADRARQAGLFETYHLIQKAVEKIGWETAGLQEKFLIQSPKGDASEGLDLTKSEDRAIFRTRVAAEFDNLGFTALVKEAKRINPKGSFANRNAAIRCIADARIATLVGEAA